MFRKFFSIIFVYLVPLALYSQYPGDVIELSGPGSDSEVSAGHSIVLKTGFIFSATGGQSMILKTDTASCTPYVEEPAVFSQSLNYVVTVSPLDETRQITIGPEGITRARDTRISTVVQYFDGLGRYVQTVAKELTPQKQDLVSIQEYDDFGREGRSWLPTPIPGNSASFVSFDRIQTVAQSANAYNDRRPFTEPVYESSPLKRILEQYGPGEAWENAKSSKIHYYANTSTGELSCARYKVTGTAANPQLEKSGKYDSGQLFVVCMKDEDGNISYEFKNVFGQLLLNRKMEGDTPHDTYYVYDNFGLKTFVLPPIASDLLTSDETWRKNDEVLEKYAYIYQYDHRDRCIKKKFPGCDWQYFVYDKADRLILSQDGEQRFNNKNEWSFTKYDAFGRVLLTGVYTDPKTHAGLCEEINDLLVVEQVQPGHYGYTWNVLPRITYDKVLTVNYYDDYELLLSQGTYFRNAFPYSHREGYGTRYETPNCLDCSAKGLLTGTRTHLLDGSGEIVTSAFYYDDKGRIIQQISTNHLGGFDREYTLYNFTGQPLKVLKEHTSPSVPLLTELYEYTYDHAGRPIDTYHTLNGGTRELVSHLAYDELGRVQSKKLGDKETTTYDYNIRGWLTGQSSPNFKQELYYTTNPVAGGDTYYNGNISASIVKIGTETKKGYHYRYDGLNRLTEGNYGEGDGLTGNAGRFSEHLSYDKHGNIEMLRRHGVSGTTGSGIRKQNTYGEIDDLDMSYNGNQLTNVTDAAGNVLLSGVMEFKDENDPLYDDYAYDTNGRRIWDVNKNISRIRYNYLNLPEELQTRQGHQTIYTYSASGVKLRVKHITATGIEVPMTETRELGSNQISLQTVTDYVGNKIYEDGQLKMIQTPEGYLAYNQDMALIVGQPPTSNWYYYYNLRDHLGSNRVTMKKQNNSMLLLEKTHYYPFGMPITESTTSYYTIFGDNTPDRFKYNNKEFDKMHGINLYDHGARFYDGMIWPTADPLAEKYYDTSPYVFCMNNPIRYVDPKGKDVWDFLGGIVHSVGSNLALGTVPTNTSFVSDAGDYNAGRTVGDVISVVMGAAETIVGGGAAAGGSVATVGTAGVGSPVTVPVAAAGVGMVVHGSGVMGTAIKSLATGEGRVSEMSGKGANNLKPDSNASGDHSSFKKGSDGKISNTATYKQNPKNPTGFDEVKRVDVKGSPHKDSSGKEVKTPHVHEPKKDPRPARPDELPKK